MITDRQIQAAIKSCVSETVLNDGASGRGSGSLKLVIRRGKAGVTATWYGTWKQAGDRSKMRLGAYPGMSLREARERFKEDVATPLQQGKAPRLAAGDQQRPTVGRMFATYVENMRAKGKASADEVERMLLLADYNAADALGRERLAGEVEPGDVAAYVAAFYRKGHRGAADKGRAYVSAAFGWAMRAAHDYTATERKDWGVKANPVEAVPKDTGASTTRDRNLDADELAALWLAMDANGSTIARCVQLLIACGQRVEETLRIEGRDVNLKAGEWRMPAEKTKGGEYPHTIPLPAQAVEVLRELIARRGDGYLFPSRGGSEGPTIGHRSVNRFLARWSAGKVAPFQSRDLRRTWKSRAHDAGVDRYTRDLIQQHARGDTGSKHYDRAVYLPQMREAMNRYSLWLSETTERYKKTICADAKAA